MIKSDFFKRNKGPILFAHRGCSHAAPENTLAAFLRAKEHSIPGVELDIRLCATGEMVVFHDDNFTRIFGTEGTIETTSFAELRKMDAGAHKGEIFKGEKVPLLSEVFEHLGNEMIYDIEIKNRGKVTGELETELFRLIRKYGLEKKCLTSSFNPLNVRKFRKIAPSIPTAVIFAINEKIPWYLRRGEGRYISGSPILKPHRDMINRNYMRRNAERQGYPVLPWTVDDSNLAENFLDLGVSGLISNRPEDLKHLFKNQ